MNTPIFDFSDYKALIKEQIKTHEDKRGYQSRLAEAAGCQPSFLSQALNSHIQLTPDHAAGMATFWNFNEDETEYFMTLVNLSRAMAPSYKSILNKKLKVLKQKIQDISQRVKLPTLSESQQQSEYYSAWMNVAIHMIVGIPQFQKSSQIAERLRLPLGIVDTTLSSLEKMGLVQNKSGRWIGTQKLLHTGRNNPLTKLHHLNWRQKAMENVYLNDPDSLHYSAIHTLSFEDFEKLKNILLDFVDKSKKIVGPSAEQEIICVNLDCFKL